jgi:hypothetical protein
MDLMHPRKQLAKKILIYICAVLTFTACETVVPKGAYRA